jgi:transcriptional regulator with XRE-family HTH domain
MFELMDDRSLATLRIRLGHCVKLARENANLTQEELANRAELSVGYLSKIERGRETPLTTFQKIADAIGIPLSEMLTEARTGDYIDDVLNLVIRACRLIEQAKADEEVEMLYTASGSFSI